MITPRAGGALDDGLERDRDQHFRAFPATGDGAGVVRLAQLDEGVSDAGVVRPAGLIGIGGAGDVTQRGLDVGDISGISSPLTSYIPSPLWVNVRCRFSRNSFLAFGLAGWSAIANHDSNPRRVSFGDPEAISINNSASSSKLARGRRPRRAGGRCRPTTHPRPSSRRRSAPPPTCRRGGPGRVPNETTPASRSASHASIDVAPAARHTSTCEAACTVRAISASNRVATRRRSTTREAIIVGCQDAQIGRRALRQVPCRGR